MTLHINFYLLPTVAQPGDNRGKSCKYCDMRAETRTMKQEEMAVAMQWHGKHLSTAMNAHITIELLGHCYAMWCFLCSLCQSYIMRTQGWLPQSSCELQLQSRL
jgi:hypothetical protein